MAKEAKLDTLEQIKRLLILQLLKGDVSSDSIGEALGMDGSSIRHMMSVKKAKGKKKK